MAAFSQPHSMDRGRPLHATSPVYYDGEFLQFPMEHVDCQTSCSSQRQYYDHPIRRSLSREKRADQELLSTSAPEIDLLIADGLRNPAVKRRSQSHQRCKRMIMSLFNGSGRRATSLEEQRKSMEQKKDNIKDDRKMAFYTSPMIIPGIYPNAQHMEPVPLAAERVTGSRFMFSPLNFRKRTNAMETDMPSSDSSSSTSTVQVKNDWSGWTPKEITFASLTGFCSGYACKKFARTAGLLFGIGFIGIQILARAQIVKVNWSRMEDYIISKFDQNGDKKVDVRDLGILSGKIIRGLAYDLPSSVGFAAAFWVGFKYA